MTLENDIQPFLKWAGGKRWFVQNYAGVFPKKYNVYIEPFLGSGAVFFHLKPQKAILADINKELMNTYKAVKVDWKKVVRYLKIHNGLHSNDYYYKIRNEVPHSRFSRAARLIYLNRTCWNALYRVNLKGNFNVPIGTKTNVLLEDDSFSEVADLLKRATLKNAGFETTIDNAKKGDLLFVDPPYTVKHNNNNFVKYNETLFSWEDQKKLKQVLINAQNRGVNIILTNAYHPFVINLYKKHFSLKKLYRSSVIAASSDNRGKTEELLVVSKIKSE